MFCIISLGQSLFNGAGAPAICHGQMPFSLSFIMAGKEKSSSGVHMPFSLNEAISVQVCVFTTKQVL
jgi:hypothetical protein